MPLSFLRTAVLRLRALIAATQIWGARLLQLIARRKALGHRRLPPILRGSDLRLLWSLSLPLPIARAAA